MSNAPERISKLTRAQRKVLADLELFSDDDRRVAIASRKLAETTGLSRTTVRVALSDLNDLGLIRTYAPHRPRASEHTLLFPVSVRLGNGPICPSTRRSSTGGRAR